MVWMACHFYSEVLELSSSEDVFHPYNIVFRDHCRALGLSVAYEEEPGGDKWAYWNRNIRKVRDWLPIRPPQWA